MAKSSVNSRTYRGRRNEPSSLVYNLVFPAFFSLLCWNVLSLSRSSNILIFAFYILWLNINRVHRENLHGKTTLQPATLVLETSHLPNLPFKVSQDLASHLQTIMTNIVHHPQEQVRNATMFFTRGVSVTNFVVASSALAFQAFVLYPWHKQLDEDFVALKKENQRVLQALQANNLKEPKSLP
jgi:hypothetical protein